MNSAPYTGWDRADFAALADRMLLAAWRYASPSQALITPPGAAGGYGSAIDGLEGFARTFLLAGFRIAGERGADPLNLLERYAAGLAAGTDPASPHRWVTPKEHGQAKVEAASIALILDLTRPWLWDRLDHAVQERVVDYLAQVVGDPDYPRTNWVWFRIVVEQFLASVGGPWSVQDMESDLAAHETFVREGGWYCDGEERNFDHYCGWALHLYPILWSRMAGAEQMASPRLPAYKERLDRYLLDAVRLVGADGSPLIQGRSLVYRFAAAAPFWVGAVAETTAVEPGVLRRAAAGIVKHFTEHGAPNEEGLLTLGWHHPWRRMAQRYSGPGSPYWAAKGLLGLALPADHPVWTSTEKPLPVEEGDQLAVIEAAGWIVSATRADGVVRIHNHGTDHALPGDRIGDSPLYARLGYSTATAPVMSDEGWDAPLDQAVVLLDAAGNATHRTGFARLGGPEFCRTEPAGSGSAESEAAGSEPAESERARKEAAGSEPARTEPAGSEPIASEPTASQPHAAAMLASRARCHWVDPDRTVPDHGSGRPGPARDAATVTTVSIVRGAWEVRCVRVDPAGAPGWPEVVALRVGGWPVSAAEPHTTQAAGGQKPHAAAWTPGGPVSTAVGLAGFTESGVARTSEATPLGPFTAVPWLRAVPDPHTWAVAALALNAGSGLPHLPRIQLSGPADSTLVTITWPDGFRTTAPLPASEKGNP